MLTLCGVIKVTVYHLAKFKCKQFIASVNQPVCFYLFLLKLQCTWLELSVCSPLLELNSQVNDIGLGQPLTAQVRLVGSEWAATWRCLLRHSGLSAQVTKYVIVFPGDKLYTVVAFMHAKTIKSLMLNIKWANRARILRCMYNIN